MTLQEIINECESIVFFGGAGVSTESGIPDFRSVDGLYNQNTTTHLKKYFRTHFFITIQASFINFTAIS